MIITKKTLAAIENSYELKGKEVIDITYSIVNNTWKVTLVEEYIGHRNENKIRTFEEIITNEEVNKIIGEAIGSEDIRYIMSSLDREIVRHEQIVETLSDNNSDNNTIKSIIDKIEYIDNMIDILEREL